jgi:formimidoylglutamate deiminase
MMTSYFADFAWLPHGWASNVQIDVGEGAWRQVGEDVPRDAQEHLGRYVLPGMPNLHSHAFQRAMAGLAERLTHTEDSFWTWRETIPPQP